MHAVVKMLHYKSCICSCVRTSVWVCMHECVCVHMSARVCIHASVRESNCAWRACLRVSKHVCTHTRTRACTCMSMCERVWRSVGYMECKKPYSYRKRNNTKNFSPKVFKYENIRSFKLERKKSLRIDRKRSNKLSIKVWAKSFSCVFIYKEVHAIVKKWRLKQLKKVKHILKHNLKFRQTLGIDR